MEVWRYAMAEAPVAGPCVLTLGNFDGVHAGHRQLLQQAAQSAQVHGLRAAVVTFDPHPTVVVAPERTPRRLMTLAQRLAAFESEGVALVWVLPFSRSFSELEPEAFMAGLSRALSPREIHVGTAFRFGRNRAGSVATLSAWGQAHGCAIHTLALRAADGGRLSSTRIREALERGEVEAAADWLGQPYTLTGIVVEGDRRGRHLGFPTANLAWEQGQLPAFGVYVTQVELAHQPGFQLGLTNVGQKPTFDGQQLTVETHLPGYEGDLYGTSMTVRFLHGLRGEARFASVEELRAQITRDVAEGKAWWKLHRG